ncbi:hypothetical protein F7725_007469 [Dissostichus mawsoni]|uniref:AarF domain-containing protein kinase 1 n=1 Tax=Dissostichus mawsoni TaxID=36200 RepID=A0A7J5Y4G7_DISMA|nr:hypothetical protein F7725_007469 [Dissostichus mawsoni]
MAGGAGAGAGTMAAGAGTGVGTMAAGHGTGAGTMAVWAGSGAGTMAAGHGTGTPNHGCVGWYWSTVPWLCGPALEHGTMAAGTATGVGTMATGAGTMAAGAGTGTGTMATGAPAGILALRLLETFWRLRGPPEARRDPKKGLSHSGNKLQSQGLLATSRRTSFREKPHGAASLAQVHKALLHDGRTVAIKVQHPKVQSQSVKDIVMMEVSVSL